MVDIKQDIIDIIREINAQVEIDAGDTGGSLFDAGLDSLDHASVLLEIQERFGCRVADDDIDKMTTVDAIAEYVEAATP